MPAPSGTLSRWAPATTTRPGSPVVVSAITFREVCCRIVVSSTSDACWPSRRAAPAVFVTAAVGTTPGVSPRVAGRAASSVLTTITAAAPAAPASRDFWPNSQVPRSTTAMAPAGIPV